MEFYFNAFYISDSTYKSLRFSYQKRKRIKDRPREFCDATNKKKNRKIETSYCDQKEGTNIAV